VCSSDLVFEHGAVKEGCTSCHKPHGSVNQKMLVARDQNLCLRCHLTRPPGDAASAGQISTSSRINVGHTGELHNSDVQRGTCWSAGCHEAIHGSNVNNHFRN
jgi:predicted CXXCH cytochrome family protein